MATTDEEDEPSPVVQLPPSAGPPELVTAFEAFYRGVYDRLAGALAYTLGDEELGAEAADEAMARAYARWAMVRDLDNPAGWVYRVGLNWARSVHRRLARRPLPDLRAEAGGSMVADYELREALRSLPVDLRSVVVCRHLLDWSVEQTAAALALRPGTVKSRLHRALALLEARLADEREGRR